MKKSLLKDTLLTSIILIIAYCGNYLFPELLGTSFGSSDFLFFVPVLTVTLLSLFLMYYLLSKDYIKINWVSLMTRLRIRRFKLNSFLIASLIFLVVLLVQGLFKFIFEDSIIFKVLNLPSSKYLNQEVKNQITLYTLPFGLLLVAFVEELFWRGYLLPIQEKQYGKYAWVVNGVLWGISHAFIYNPLSLIILFLGLPYIAQRFKNTSITIILHVFNNSIMALYWIMTY